MGARSIPQKSACKHRKVFSRRRPQSHIIIFGRVVVREIIVLSPVIIYCIILRSTSSIPGGVRDMKEDGRGCVEGIIA